VCTPWFVILDKPLPLRTKKKEYKRGHPGTAREQQPLMGQFLNLKASSFLG